MRQQKRPPDSGDSGGRVVEIPLPVDRGVSLERPPDRPVVG